MPFNLPIFLTWLRIALIPLFVSVLYLPVENVSARNANLIAAAIFVAAALTD